MNKLQHGNVRGRCSTRCLAGYTQSMRQRVRSALWGVPERGGLRAGGEAHAAAPALLPGQAETGDMLDFTCTPAASTTATARCCWRPRSGSRRPTRVDDATARSSWRSRSGSRPPTRVDTAAARSSWRSRSGSRPPTGVDDATARSSWRSRFGSRPPTRVDDATARSSWRSRSGSRRLQGLILRRRAHPGGPDLGADRLQRLMR